MNTKPCDCCNAATVDLYATQAGRVCWGCYRYLSTPGLSIRKAERFVELVKNGKTQAEAYTCAVVGG